MQTTVHFVFVFLAESKVTDVQKRTNNRLRHLGLMGTHAGDRGLLYLLVVYNKKVTSLKGACALAGALSTCPTMADVDLRFW